jgi:thiol-disulfide isomerase/thioredoxin
MDLIYYYNNHCGSCKGYETEVDKLATELKLTPQKQNIDEIKPIFTLRGIPTIILTDDDDNEIWRSLGNIPYEHLITDVKKVMK